MNDHMGLRTVCLGCSATSLLQKDILYTSQVRFGAQADKDLPCMSQVCLALCDPSFSQVNTPSLRRNASSLQLIGCIRQDLARCFDSLLRRSYISTIQLDFRDHAPDTGLQFTVLALIRQL
jgi:hypothetical protein